MFSLYSKSDLHFAVRAWTQSFMASLNLQGSHMPPQRCQSQERTCDYCILYSPFHGATPEANRISFAAKQAHLLIGAGKTDGAMDAANLLTPGCGSWMIIRVAYR